MTKTKLYTYTLDREKVLLVEEKEVEGQLSINDLEVILIDIKLQGYNDTNPVYLTVEQHEHFRNELFNPTKEPWKIKYEVQLVSSLLSDNTIIINNKFYVDEGNLPNANPKYIGHSGQVFKYKKFNSDKVIETNNMWNGSKIPEHLKHLMKDNAVWVQ